MTTTLASSTDGKACSQQVPGRGLGCLATSAPSFSPSGATDFAGRTAMNFNVRCTLARGVQIALGAPLAMRSRSATRPTRRTLIASRSRATKARIDGALFVPAISAAYLRSP
jgi:hypothetical protein